MSIERLSDFFENGSWLICIPSVGFGLLSSERLVSVFGINNVNSFSQETVVWKIKGNIRDGVKMQDYERICLLVSVFAAVREFRPIAPFLTAFLTSPYVNLTSQEVNQEVYPHSTYSSLTQVVLVFLVTDYLRYKPMIVLGSIAGCILYLLLLAHPSLLRVQISQIFFGLFSTAHVAYFSYMYARIEDKSLYQEVTGHARASVLVGRFLNGLVAQLGISSGAFDYNDLLYLSVAGTVVTLAISLLFPPVQHSTYFHKRKSEPDQKIVDGVIHAHGGSDFKASENSPHFHDIKDSLHRKSLNKTAQPESALSHLWHDFKAAFSSPIVIKWSSWLVFAKGCHFLVVTYNQILWQTVAKETKSVSLMNGAVEAISTIISAGAAYLVARMSNDWRKGHSAVLFLSCLSCGALLFYSGISTNLWLVYVAYIAYGFIFQSTLTIAESQVAQNLLPDSYGLVFGFLNFLAISLTSLFTVSIVQCSIFCIGADAHQQFKMYGVFFLVLAVFVALENILNSCRRSPSSDLAVHSTI
ncbi:unnamed protein product [Bemisia tabaci]|uniref:Reduced folate carrier n=2 Tax=Bemisia tabaci TaxID=7038 RepID=A0A9N9ZZ37_BEMTA|nr:unnamed protein product [Bemisia tabaci]